MKNNAVSLIRGLGRRLVVTRSGSSVHSLNASHVPVGMLDVERITRVQPPVSTIVSRPVSTSSVKV